MFNLLDLELQIYKKKTRNFTNFKVVNFQKSVLI